jgi:RNA polymerase sigma factor (sigma-70 family)
VTDRPDIELIREYAENGSDSAFTELTRRHINLVYSTARRVVVDPHLAEDVTQATFTALASSARGLLDRPTLAPWLHRTASNLAANLVRGEMRRRAREKEAFAMQTTPDSDSDWTQLAPVLDAALNELAEPDRVLLVLRFFEKQSSREIATVLRLSDEAAQKRVQRALERLRSQLLRNRVALSTATIGAVLTGQAVTAAPAGLATSVSAMALASAATAGGIAWTTTQFLIMTKLKWAAASAAVIAAVATPLILQQQNITRLREENQALRTTAQQAATLRDESENLAKQLDSQRQNQTLSKSQLTELMRLRNEIGPLRRDSQDLARLRDDRSSNSGTPNSGAGFLAADSWANVGSEQPESAIETFFWAGKHNETNLIGSLLRWRRDPEIPASNELDQTFAQGLVSATTQFAGELHGFRVTSKEQETENVTRLSVELTDAKGAPQTHTLRLVREDNQWFPVMHVWMHEPGSVRGALDIPEKFQR